MKFTRTYVQEKFLATLITARTDGVKHNTMAGMECQHTQCILNGIKKIFKIPSVNDNCDIYSSQCKMIN